jgi:predicted O-methyltransferase YrrM
MSLPEIRLDQIASLRISEVQLRSLPYEDGQLPDDQARVLIAIALAYHLREILEIGTFFGHTTVRLADALPNAVIHTVDLPAHYDSAWKGYMTDFHLINRRHVGREFNNRKHGRIIQHLADTMTWDFANAGSPTFFFIDGSHSYQYVKNDSEKCSALCRGKGVFVWHDADDAHPGVLQLLTEWRALGRDVRKIAGFPLALLQP